MHVVQTEEARAECRELMMPQKHIISSQENAPSIGLVQDSLLASMKFTKDEVLLEKDAVCNILMWMKSWDGKMPKPSIKEPKELWTGKQLFSLLLPEELNYEIKSASSIDKYKNVKIRNGKLEEGVIDKKSVGQTDNSLIHVIYNDYGEKPVTSFINELQLMVNYWLLHNGASIGLSDMIGDRTTMIEISSIIEKAKKEVNSLGKDYKEGNLKGQPGQTLEQTFESKANGELNLQDDIVKVIQKNLPDDNNLKQMMESGSKGKALNMFRIIGCVGQQNVRGRRIDKGFKKRTLPHYERDVMDVESRGFIESSYIKGLNPREFYFHAMSKFSAH